MGRRARKIEREASASLRSRNTISPTKLQVDGIFRKSEVDRTLKTYDAFHTGHTHFLDSSFFFLKNYYVLSMIDV